jgi:cation:H+ antiporter
MFLVWIKFIACLLIIVISGRFVAKYGDTIAEKTGLGGLWIGIILIAVTTSLPELFTGISAAALLKAPDLTVGDLFGANVFNLFNLALLDIASRNGSLVSFASSRHSLSVGLSMIMVAFPALCLFVSYSYSSLAIGWVGVYTPVMFILYAMIVKTICDFESKDKSPVRQSTEEISEIKSITLKKAYIYYLISAIAIIGAGTWLAFIGDEIAVSMGWKQSFVGSLFLAFTTTLPEITVSFSALRLGAIDLCIANMIGSNIFNMAVIGIVDLFYTEGPVLASVSQNHIFTAFIIVIMSGIVIAGIMLRPRHTSILRVNWFSLSLIVLFCIAMAMNYII